MYTNFDCLLDYVRAGKDTRKMECDCAVPKEADEEPCGDSCLNRAMMIECGNRCKNQDKCQNKNFQKRKYADLEIFWTNGKGHGLKALAPIKRGNFIIEYMGEVVSAKEFKKRSHEYSKARVRIRAFIGCLYTALEQNSGTCFSDLVKKSVDFLSF